MRTRFVLIQTSHAGNVGGVARAMKIMGFDDLVLVQPRWANVLRREETIQRASGANDVLAKTRIVDTLDEALDGVTHLCATAMTPRDFGPPTRAPREHFARLLLRHTRAARGRGLSVRLRALRHAQRRRVPLPRGAQHSHRARFRLAQPGGGGAADRLRLAPGAGWFCSATGRADQRQPADAQAIGGMLTHLEQALVAVDFLDPDAPKKLMPRLNQLFNRAAPSEEEIHILRGVAKAMLQVAEQGQALDCRHVCPPPIRHPVRS